MKRKINAKSAKKEANKTPKLPRTKLTTQQKDKNTPVEALIPVFINDYDVQTAVMDFVTYLRENKFELKRGGISRWVVMHNKHQILSFCLGRNADWWCKNDYWYVDLTPTYLHVYEDSIIAASLQDFVLSNIKFCVNCSLGCFPGKNAVILNKEIIGICITKQFLYFCDPGAKVISSIKRLAELEKKARTNATREELYS